MERIDTERLSLRQWCSQDRKPFAELCADPHVMRYFPSTKTESEANALIDRLSATISEHGYGFWAAELRSNQQFIGFVGLNPLQDDYDFAPCVEVGWRLKQSAWGNGYATEAAYGALRYGFDTLKLKEIVAITPLLNLPSENVMKKLGMTKQESHFKHPRVALDSPLSEHILYKIKRAEFIDADQ